MEGNPYDNDREDPRDRAVRALFRPHRDRGVFAGAGPVHGLLHLAVPGFVTLAGMLLGSRRGSLAVAVYVAVGLAGIPVFAAGGGIQYVFRPSFGYLLGFIAAAWLTGRICERTGAGRFGQFLPPPSRGWRSPMRSASSINF